MGCPFDLVVIGSSWGGLHAVGEVLAHVPRSTGLSIVVAQHRRPEDSPLAGLLADRSGWTVCEAEDKEQIAPGQAYVAPPGYHLLIDRGTFSLSTEGPVHYSRPSVDVLFESAADAYQDRLLAVVLTGANDDGAEGLAHVKRRGGFTVVQDPTTAERRAMPDAAITAGPDRVLPLEEIGPFVSELCSGKVPR